VSESRKKHLDFTHRWIGRLLVTGGAQAGVQLMGFVGGLIVIRMLAPEQYASYTIAMAALGLLTVISDAGVSTAMVSFASGVWREESRFKTIFSEAMHMRRQLSIIAMVIAFPCLMIIAYRHGDSWLSAGILALAILPQYLCTLTGQLREALLKIQDRIAHLQWTQLGQSLVRPLFLLAALSLAPVAWVALLAAGASQWCCNIALKRLTPNFTERGVPDLAIRTQYLKYVKKTLPSALYYGISGQISVGIIAFMGNGQEIAQVGVAGRLAMLCNIIGSVANVLLVVRFAKMRVSPPRLYAAFFAIIIPVLGFGFTLAILVQIYPQSIPLIAGARYSGLTDEVTWSLIAGVLNLASGIAYSLCAVRNMVMQPVLIIPIAISAMVISAFCFELNNALGIFHFQALYGAIVLGVYIAYFLFHSRRHLNP
jgi:O-antigen/teichoic acid export membrane protein